MFLERWLRTLPLRLRSLFRREALEHELDDELRDHLDRKTRHYVAAGLSAEEARHQAIRDFDGLEVHKEECREAQRVSWAYDLLQDIRYGLRLLGKSSGFTVIAALTLALGIGANTAIFSLVSGILLAPLPYPDPGALTLLNQATYPKGAVVAMREQLHSMDVGAYADGHEFNLTGSGEAVRLEGTLVSAEFFSILHVAPEIGRVFRVGEDQPGQDRFVILSHALWQRRFGGSSTILGRVIELDGVGREVIGVLPATFRFPSLQTEVWVPLENDPRNAVAYWAGDFMPVIGRLHSGATLAQANAEVHIFQSQVFALFPWPMPASWNANVIVISLQDGLVSNVRSRLLILLGAVALVLFIACANVANLTLSRVAAREKEIAIRSSIGAPRWRITQQLLTESVLLALLGGSLGLVLAMKGLQVLRAVLPIDTPRLTDVRIDWRVLLFTGALAILTGFLFGIAPALQASRGTLVDVLKSTGRGAAASLSHRLRSTLAVAEVALAVLLVIAAGLLVRSLWALSHVDPGFRTAHLLTARLTPNQSFCDNPARCLTFYRTLLEGLRSKPGISDAAVINTLPLNGRVAKRNVDLESYVLAAGPSAPLFWLNIVSSEYFRVMGIPILSGRDFSDSDSSGNPPGVVVTASTARRYWPNQAAVGKHLRLLNEKEWRTVVGVIQDVRAYDLQSSTPKWIEGTAYVPYSPSSLLEDGRLPAEMTLALRTTLDEATAAAGLREAVQSLNRGVPVSDVKAMKTIVADSAATPAATASLFGIFAGLALVLGAIGIYGVISFLVSRRTQEIGIRMALGAQPRHALWLVMGEGVRLSFTGIALGLAAAFAASRVLSGELYGVSPLDFVTYASVAGVMVLVSLLACYVPTRRAMRLDPLIALRQD